MIMAFGFDAGYYGTKTVRRNREKLHCNVPFIILFDPTSACNLHCKGCWAAEYGHKQSLTNEEMQSIVSQGKALGTHVYMLTGGEPLIRKNDIIELAANNQDCVFLIYTNATLVDQKFCDDLKRVGNVALAMSIEGTEESNAGAAARELTMPRSRLWSFLKRTSASSAFRSATRAKRRIRNERRFHRQDDRKRLEIRILFQLYARGSRCR